MKSSRLGNCGWWSVIALAASALLWWSGRSLGASGKTDNAGPVEDLVLEGRLVAPNGLSVSKFDVRPGGLLEWSGKVRLGYGGDEGRPLPPSGELVRARPGGNLFIQPQQDYARSALDLLPTRGKRPDLDAIAELTIHRMPPTPADQEMLSLSGLGIRQDMYAAVVEAHGAGRLKPLAFMVVQGGLNDGEAGFYAEAMRMTEQGTMVFGLHREAGPIQRPVDSITISQPDPSRRGAFSSDALAWVGKWHDGQVARQVHWRAQAHVRDAHGSSQFVLDHQTASGQRVRRLELTDTGILRVHGADVEVTSPDSGIVLHSPNGKRWRIRVDDDGSLRTAPASTAEDIR